MSMPLNEVYALLSRTPAVFQSWFSGLPEPWLNAHEGEGTFTARDVLVHLIHGERTDWMARVHVILEHGESRPFEPFDRRGFFDEAQAWSMSALLNAFASCRAANLEALKALDLQPQDLSRRGSHPELGPVTMEQLLATWVAHDLGHLAQAARVMAKRYRRAVGPWAGYLPILSK